ncbi:cytochrome P450 [Actinospongicola halichondriae]|uniref:cytochrome P450 n=1 Tax=Actinospongicola halichondriae TaxID=3236844 RepID=UPI003D53D271
MSTIERFDPFAAEVLADPYPHYARLRDDDPVSFIPELDLWMVTRYDDVSRILHDPDTFSSADGMGALMSGGMGRNRIDARDAFGIDLRTMRILIATDPPDHTRLRRLLSKAFTPRAIADLEPHLRDVCDQLVDDLIAAAEGGHGDLVTHVAFPFPVIVIAELLGIPPERRDDFKRWSDALVGALSGSWNPVEAQQTLIEMFTYLADIVERRRADPADDLISRLVAGNQPDDPDALTAPEITLFAILLLVAGNETTTNLIGNGAAAFAAHPDQAQRLADEPELLPAATEEILRWDAPVQGLFRATTHPTTLAGVDLPQGAVILASFAAANRDPRHFPDPDQFDITRRPTDHLAFGHGIHYCLGASLARLETKILAETLRSRAPNLRPAGTPSRVDSIILRGFTSYPVTTI